ncbi:MAG: STAS domain-containing protein [Spirochaetales bacterium]|nr:STAS domain-containing protein [Spirochaetales bacterium]
MLPVNNLEIQRREEGAADVLYLKGEVNLFNCPEVKESIDELVGRGRTRIVLNLEHVSFIDSSGLGALISGHTNLRKSGSALRLACVPANIMKTFELTNLQSFFGIFPTEEQALQSFPD